MTDRWINVLLIGTIISASFLYTLGKNKLSYNIFIFVIRNRYIYEVYIKSNKYI